MNTKRQCTEFLSYLPSNESVNSTKVATQKMSPCVTSDNPVPLGKCHFPVTFLAFSKCDIRPATNHQLQKTEVEPRHEHQPKIANNFLPPRNVESLVRGRGFRQRALSSRICPRIGNEVPGPKSQHFLSGRWLRADRALHMLTGHLFSLRKEFTLPQASLLEFPL